jgi:uncharacterized protein with HEPN domain
MTQRDDVRLNHMREAAGKAIAFSRDRSREDLDTDEILRLALTKLVEIVGEAAKHASADIRSQYPNAPWDEAARMRDRLVHHYFDINLDVLWSTVTEDLPALLKSLEEPAEDASDL